MKNVRSLGIASTIGLVGVIVVGISAALQRPAEVPATGQPSGYPGPDPLDATPSPVPAVSWHFPPQMPSSQVAQSILGTLIQHGRIPADTTVVSSSDVTESQLSDWSVPDLASGSEVNQTVVIYLTGNIVFSLPGIGNAPSSTYGRVLVNRATGFPYDFSAANSLSELQD